jgi:hypothetical protein
VRAAQRCTRRSWTSAKPPWLPRSGLTPPAPVAAPAERRASRCELLRDSSGTSTSVGPVHEQVFQGCSLRLFLTVRATRGLDTGFTLPGAARLLGQSWMPRRGFPGSLGIPSPWSVPAAQTGLYGRAHRLCARDDAHGRRKGRCGCTGKAGDTVPRRPRASGQVERLERAVQGDCAAPQKLRLGRGRRALAEILRVNTTIASLDLCDNDLGEGGGRALAQTLRVNTTIASLNTARQHHGYVARPSRQ